MKELISKKTRYEFREFLLKTVNCNLSKLADATSLLDTTHLADHIKRIEKAVTDDPSLAIGSTKELVEATLKTILKGLREGFDESSNIPDLLKKVQKKLELSPKDVDDSKKGADVIKKILSNIGSIIVGVSELRNLYGTGHGHASKRKGVNERHARFIVSIGGSLCHFLLETYESRYVFNGIKTVDELIRSKIFKSREAFLSFLKFLDGQWIADDVCDGFYEGLYNSGFTDEQLDIVMEYRLIDFNSKPYIPDPNERFDPSTPETIGFYELTPLGKRIVSELTSKN